MMQKLASRVWLANFINTFHSSVADSALIQEQLVAQNLGSIADRVCTSNASVTYVFPCIFRTNKTAFYAITNSSLADITVVTPGIGINAITNTLCIVNTSFLRETTGPVEDRQLKYVACDSTDTTPARLCFSKQDNGMVKITRGTCT